MGTFFETQCTTCVKYSTIIHSFLGFYAMSLLLKIIEKNTVAPQVYPQKNLKITFFREKSVVLYTVPNFWDQEPRLEGSKTLCPKTKTKTLKLSLETKTWVLRTTSLLRPPVHYNVSTIKYKHVAKAVLKIKGVHLKQFLKNTNTHCKWIPCRRSSAATCRWKLSAAEELSQK